MDNVSAQKMTSGSKTQNINVDVLMCEKFRINVLNELLEVVNLVLQDNLTTKEEIVDAILSGIERSGLNDSFNIRK